MNANEMTEIIYKRESYAIIGACFEYERIAKTKHINPKVDPSDVSL